MVNEEALDVLDEILIDVLNGDYPSQGICYSLAIGMGFYLPSETSHHIKRYFDSWEYTTGSEWWPIPENESFSRWEGANLQLRISLLCHIIREMTIELYSE